MHGFNEFLNEKFVSSKKGGWYVVSNKFSQFKKGELILVKWKKDSDDTVLLNNPLANDDEEIVSREEFLLNTVEFIPRKHSKQLNVYQRIFRDKYNAFVDPKYFMEITPIDAGVNFKSEDVTIPSYCTTLKGCPEIIKHNFTILTNPMIASLEGAPRIIYGRFQYLNRVQDSLLKTLKNGPEHTGSYIVDSHSLISLEGAPKYVEKFFNCSVNDLESLEGLENTDCRDINCSTNPLKTLKGSPPSIRGNFYCENTEIETLEGAPQLTSSQAVLDCSNNPNLKSLKGLPKGVKILQCKDTPLLDDFLAKLDISKDASGQIYGDDLKLIYRVLEEGIENFRGRIASKKFNF